MHTCFLITQILFKISTYARSGISRLENSCMAFVLMKVQSTAQMCTPTSFLLATRYNTGPIYPHSSKFSMGCQFFPKIRFLLFSWRTYYSLMLLICISAGHVNNMFNYVLFKTFAGSVDKTVNFGTLTLFSSLVLLNLRYDNCLQRLTRTIVQVLS